MRSHTLILISSFILAALLVVFVPLPVAKVKPNQRTIQVAASSFEFSPAEIAVNPGDIITIELTSTDVVHGLHLDGYSLQVSADPGQTETLISVADRAGTFRFRC